MFGAARTEWCDAQRSFTPSEGAVVKNYELRAVMKVRNVTLGLQHWKETCRAHGNLVNATGETSARVNSKDELNHSSRTLGL